MNFFEDRKDWRNRAIEGRDLIGIEGGQIEQELERLGQRGPAEGRQGVAGPISMEMSGCMTDILRSVSDKASDDLSDAHSAYLMYFVGQGEVVEEKIEIVGGVIC